MIKVSLHCVSQHTVYSDTKNFSPSNACQIPQVSLYMTHISMYDCGKHSLVTSFNKLISYTYTLLKLLTKFILCFNSYQMKTSTILRKHVLTLIFPWKSIFTGAKAVPFNLSTRMFKKKWNTNYCTSSGLIIKYTRYIITHKKKIDEFFRKQNIRFTKNRNQASTGWQEMLNWNTTISF